VAILGFIEPVYDALHNLRLHLEHGEMAIHWVLAALALTLGFAIRSESLLAGLTIVAGFVTRNHMDYGPSTRPRSI
jgi:hypothetical protein